MATLWFAAIYVALAALSWSTAFVQPNTAAVWAPSGFAVGLLIARGLGRWPAVALGSFAFNLAVNLAAEERGSGLTALVVALVIAAGNTGEALVGGYLARRFASGAGYMSRVESAAKFVLFVAPVAPLVSTPIGALAIDAAGIPGDGTVWDVMLTWYVANCVGIMVCTGLTVLVFEGEFTVPYKNRLLEALVLLLCVCFVSQAIGGYFLTGWISDWLKTYMVVPILIWACFRFGKTGALLSILAISCIAVLGTLHGYVAFPSKNPWLALVYLQIFIGMLSIIALAISAALAELSAMQATLEERVKDRTRQIERLMREREVFTILVAHDLQSPIYGVRNALRESATAIANDKMSLPELASAFAIMEQTCSTLAGRVSGLLTSARDLDVPHPASAKRLLVEILGSIASAHRVTTGTLDSRLVYEGDRALSVSHPSDVEHIIDALIDNAMKYDPTGSQVGVTAFRHGGWIEIHVSDQGPGIASAAQKALFKAGRGERAGDLAGGGLGLFLASEKAFALEGRLTYSPGVPQGSTFRLVIPA